MMDLSGLYELLERFHRSNQLPAFLIGAVAALAGAYAVLRWCRLRIFSDAARDGEINSLLKQVNTLTAEKNQCLAEQRHIEKHADALKARLFELSGREQAQADAIKELSAERERIQQKLQRSDQERQRLFERNQKRKRIVARLNAMLEKIAVSDGRIWEAEPESGAPAFRPLSQRRTTILSLVNLKGGVGKTTIAANLAVAMNKHGWRVLAIDLDHQSSLSQLLLAPEKMDELVVSRRFIHKALQDATEGLANFRQAIERVDQSSRL